LQELCFLGTVSDHALIQDPDTAPKNSRTWGGSSSDPISTGPNELRRKRWDSLGLLQQGCAVALSLFWRVFQRANKTGFLR